MLIIPSNAASDAYQIARSLRFNSADSATLTRTQGAGTSTRKFTVSYWSKSSVDGYVLTGHISAKEFLLGQSSNIYDVYEYNGGTVFRVQSNNLCRDPVAFAHTVVAIDTTQATAANRVRIYRNGVEVSYTGGSSYPTLNYDFVTVGVNACLGIIGSYNGGGYLDGYLAEFYFIDGQQLTPSSFGTTDSTTNSWNPIAYAGTYGTNGFYLTFSDNSNTTAATLGADSSGNGNNWTPNNFSVTAGVGNDSLTDTPTNYGTDTGAGGEVRGNYCTLNPVCPANALTGGTLSNGNLDISVAGKFGQSTIGVLSGQTFTAEFTVNSETGSLAVGVVDENVNPSTYVNSIYYRKDGRLYTDNSTFTSNSSYTTGDIISVEINGTSRVVTIRKNGTPLANTATVGGSAPLFWIVGSDSANTCTWSCNFGQRAWTQTVTTGYKAVCTQNLPDPAIAKPKQHFDTSIYTGTGASLAISTDGSTANNTLALAPDLVWLKGRSGATDHAIYDNVRGVQKDWGSNLTTDETSQAQGVTAFGSTGFTVGTLAKLNTSAATYVSWLWKAGGAAASNSVGSITSSVSVNTTAGVSALTYTGTGANATIGHGIGVAPSMVIVKARTTAGADQGAVLWHASLTTPTTDYLVLSTTAALASAATMWNSTIPTSTVFSVGTNASTNTSGDTYVAYAFSPVDGFSAFGKYTGNAAADGPFVWCGFRPRWFMVKCASATNNWVIFDAARSTYNATNEELYADVADAGGSNNRGPDFLSNGVKIRATTSFQNSSGATYVFAAFAESPFKTARAR